MPFHYAVPAYHTGIGKGKLYHSSLFPCPNELRGWFFTDSIPATPKINNKKVKNMDKPRKIKKKAPEFKSFECGTGELKIIKFDKKELLNHEC